MNLYVDGGCEGNGTANAHGYGSFLLEGDRPVRLDFGTGVTNNICEYKALIAALEYLKEMGIRNVDIFSDSALVVNQTAGKWNINVPALKPLCAEASRLMREIGASLTWVRRDTIVEKLGH